jgi:CheY-like chemotaxis protein
MVQSPQLYSHLHIIDDDIEDQEIFIEAVKEVSGTIECSSSNSGEDALTQLERSSTGRPDLIFLDLNMPKLNGKQVLKEIKSSPGLRGIPVIMYSTSFAPRDIEEIKQIGAAHHLLKPSRFNDLCSALTNILAKEWK